MSREAENMVKTTTKTKYGYLHMYTGPDMDGSLMSVEWIKDYPMEDDPQPEEGWFVLNEEGGGWLGPFETELEAIYTVTYEDAYLAYINAQDEIDC